MILLIGLDIDMAMGDEGLEWPYAYMQCIFIYS